MAIMDFPFPSDIIEVKDLTTDKAIELAIAIQTGYLPYVKLIECRVLRESRLESIVIEVEVELGQKNNVHPIRRHERIAIIFYPKDDILPEVLSLRDDFPEVPHTNLRDQGWPVSLCLYDQPYNEVKLYLTPTRFIERIRQWLADTAKGILHGEDQPLEPLFLESKRQLIIPFDLFENFNPTDPPSLELRLAKVNDSYTFIAVKPGDSEEVKCLECVATAIKAPPQTHGIIHTKPLDLLQLHELTSSIGLDLLQALRTLFQKWQREDRLKSLQNKNFILIIAFPKTRRTGETVEATDIWGFLFPDKIEKIGIEIGVWEKRNGSLGTLLTVDENKKGKDLRIEMCKTLYSFSRQMAAEQNDIIGEHKKIVMIGAGAIGSQLFMNLVRAGYGEWMVIDNDILLPHNVARHALNGYAVGFSKAECLAINANKMIDGSAIAQSEVRDILKEGDYTDVMKKALSEADVILDCTASVAAMRYITCDISSPSRRLSVFLSPSGNDSVLLAEDSKRIFPLDYLEMQYYRYVINESKLKGHLTVMSKKLRYGNSCSDINTAMSQELVALHAAVCSRGIRNALSKKNAKIILWRASPADLSVKSHAFTPTKMIHIRTKDWEICTDEWVVEKIYRARANKLPNETGGILIGSFDMQRRIVYIMDTLPSPPDSQEWPTVYIRGCQGLAQRMKEIGDETLGRLEYVGEWHSHTENGSCLPSGTDEQAFVQLADMRKADGLPAIMLIAGDKTKYAVYLGTMH